MMAKEKWNKMVEQHKNFYNAPEKTIQSFWEDYCREYFGYSKLEGEIVPHPILRIGSREKIIPDILLKRDGNDLFVIELKQYNLPFQDAFLDQLISYLQLQKVSIGILVCKEIYICSYNYASDELKKAVVPFQVDNPDGGKFIELFSKDNFDKAAVEKFIDDKLENEKKKNEQKERIEIIRKALTKDFITDIVKNFLRKDYSDEVIEEALKGYNFNIINRNITTTDIPEPPHDNIHGMDGKDKTHYIFNGNNYCKNRLVLAVIKEYVKKNQNCTVDQLIEAFPDKLQGSHGVLREKNLAIKTCKDYRKRYFVNDPVQLKTGDVIYVCNQWGIENINKFINRAKQLGFEIISKQN